MTARRVLVFPMILSLLAFRVQTAQPATTSFDCEGVGCALDPSVMGPPVCGQDGFTYHNQCVAHCQVRQRELELVCVVGVCVCACISLLLLLLLADQEAAASKSF